MRPRSFRPLVVALAVPVLMMSATTAGESQTVSSARATLGDCPGSTLVASDEAVTLEREGSLESDSGLLCRYTSATGYYKPFIEIHWTSDDSGGSDEAGACELGPGEVVKTGNSWKSRQRKVQAGWSAGIALTGGAEAEEELVGGLVRKLEGMGVGAPCAAEDDVPFFVPCAEDAEPLTGQKGRRMFLSGYPCVMTPFEKDGVEDIGVTFDHPWVVGRPVIAYPFDHLPIVACDGTKESCDWDVPESDIRQAAKEFCKRWGTDAPRAAREDRGRRVGRPYPFRGAEVSRPPKVSTDAGVRTFVSVSCTDFAPLEEVSNGCGGEGDIKTQDGRLQVTPPLAIQNWLGNEQTFRQELGGFPVKTNVRFKQSCDVHDAGYEGVVTEDPRTGKLIDFRDWSRERVDKKFLADMRAACRAKLTGSMLGPVLDQCENYGTPEEKYDGAKLGYDYVCKDGASYFNDRAGSRVNEYECVLDAQGLPVDPELPAE